MKSNNFPNFPYIIFFILLSFIYSNTLIAQEKNSKNNQNKPIHITANTLTIENKKGISTYQGNVKISQGDTLLTGDLVTVLTNGNNEVTRIKSEETGNKLAYFQEKNKDNVTIKAWGKEIVYNVQKKIVQLTGKAKLSQKGNLFTGHHIEYNQITEQVKANTPSSNSKQDRVKISIQPNTNS